MFVNPEGTIRAFNLTPGMTVADIGSGAGFFTFPLARAVGRTGTVIAVDVRREMLDLIHNRSRSQGVHNIHTVWADLEEPRALKEISDAAADAALAANVLFQLEHREAFFAEVARILVPSGMLYVIDWSPSELGSAPATQRAFGPDAAQRISKKTVQELAAVRGLLFAKEFSVGAQHYGIALRKHA